MEEVKSPKIVLYKKLLAIQQAVSGLGKDSKTNTYQYVSGSKLLSYIKPLMNQHGLLLKQEVTSITNTRQDYATKSNPNKSEILSCLQMKFTWICCDTGETEEFLFAANGQNDWDKGVGSALTYGERYGLMKFFHIATDEDDVDNPDRKEDERAPKAPAKPHSSQQPSGNNSAPQAELKWLNEKEGGKDNPIYLKACESASNGYTEVQIKASLAKNGFKCSKETMAKIMSFNKPQTNGTKEV